MAATFGMVAMGVLGLVRVAHRRRAGRGIDAAADSRLAERIEMERRLVAYIAAREDMTLQDKNLGSAR